MMAALRIIVLVAGACMPSACAVIVIGDLPHIPEQVGLINIDKSSAPAVPASQAERKQAGSRP
jgi:hypothetical protein